jgi:uncharacterized protein (DUF305 family)
VFRPSAALPAALLTGAIALTGCGGGGVEAAAPEPTRSFVADVPVLVPGAPGEEGEVVGPGQERTIPNAALFGDADVAFVRDMALHHAQALRMSELAPDRGSDARVKALAERIAAGQGPEIAVMEAWLEARGLPVPDTRGGPGHSHDGAMAGMASPEDMVRLAAAEGRAFDRLFLELMIRHHEGALQMADAASTAVQHPQVADMVADTGISQSVEIQRMRELLAQL